jgi:hypothetical protein
MWINHRFFKHFLLLALLATVLGAVLPTISKLRMVALGIDPTSVCSINKPIVQLSEKSTSNLPDDTLADQTTCAYCLLQAQAQAPFLPVRLEQVFLTADLTGRLFIGSSGTTVFNRAERSAHPSRAPPAFA